MRTTRDHVHRTHRTSLRLAAVTLTALAWWLSTSAAMGQPINLQLVSARDVPASSAGPALAAGAPLPADTTYRFMINRDDTGDPHQPRLSGCEPATNPTYPLGCGWPSLRGITGGVGNQTDDAGQALIVAQGDQAKLGGAGGPAVDLPAGRYLISVTADGHKIGGRHFTVPMTTPVVEVAAHRFPLPLATLRMKIFNDVNFTNGEFDAPQEDPARNELGWDMSGFEGHINDVVGSVTTDWYGNPICTTYVRDGSGNITLDANDRPTVDQVGGKCLSDRNGDIVIPNLGPNRYAATVTPPVSGPNAGRRWVQTTTLEGSHDFDAWIIEGDDGLDHETAVGGEGVPPVAIGFVTPRALPAGPAGGVKGVVVGAKTYTPPNAGPLLDQTPGGAADGPVHGIDRPIKRPWVALSDLRDGDRTISVSQGNDDGSFLIPNVPDGDYALTTWDDDQYHIIHVDQVSVANGRVTDSGVTFLAQWFSRIEGTVFVDANANGKQDPGEPGLADQLVVLRSRDNSIQDQGSTSATTDANGRYALQATYPLGQWIIEEVYNDRYHTTGITYQTDNQPTPTTVLGSQVDVSTFDLINLASRVDWGVAPYKPGENGGIVGTVSYDTTRNEFDADKAAIEDYQPGIAGMGVALYEVVRDAAGNPVVDPDGSLKKGPLVPGTPDSPNPTMTETWERPTGCVPRSSLGAPINDIIGFVALQPTGECVESTAMGNQVQAEFSKVNGNYGFTETLDATGNVVPLPPGDYIVEVTSPKDASGSPRFKVTREEDVNVFSGDRYTPRVFGIPACAGALHTVDVAGVGTDGSGATVNPDFAEAGGSPYEGQARNLCDAKLVTVTDRRSVAPTFTFFTDVPLPGRFMGLVIDDLNLSMDPKELYFGEKAGISHMPVGIYDWSGRLVTTVDTDPNGNFEVLLPSTGTYNCPLPAGPCPNVYRFVANDPGQPGHPNTSYNPNYRTIATNFQLWPGLTLPADLAPTTIAVSVAFPGAQPVHPAKCEVDAATPQLFSVSRPYARIDTDREADRRIVIRGTGFGATRGRVVRDADQQEIDIRSWTDSRIEIQVDDGSAPGPHQIWVIARNGKSTINAITLHLLGPGYNPTLLEVGPGRTYTTIQGALDAARTIPQALAVVYPGAPGAFNPLGRYDENLVVASPVKLQGVGPGGTLANGTHIPGTIVDGSRFANDSSTRTAWTGLVSELSWAGNQDVIDGAVVTVLAGGPGVRGSRRAARFTPQFRAAIDGLRIQGGNQMNFPALMDPIQGGSAQNPIGGLREGITTQGGGIYVNGEAHYLQVTNNVIRGNGGTYGGAVRLGTPMYGSSRNDHVRIAGNQIIGNGGTNLAGAIGLFAGSDDYEVTRNDICGNFSAEYGGGVSHYGRSPRGRIHHNRIYFNNTYDEGAGIMVAGELPANPNLLSDGSGPVDITENVVQSNMANDDGGGIRVLMAGNEPINIVNNMIVNNISTHEGAGIALDDATSVRIVNNTIAKNITTATAATSDGQPAPAGLSTTGNSNQLQATLPAGASQFSNPVLFNNIFWDNRAGRWDGATVAGIGLAGDMTPVNHWDMGVTGSAALAACGLVGDSCRSLAPRYSIIQQDRLVYPFVPHPSNRIGTNPQFLGSYDTTVRALPWRGDPSFVGSVTIALDVPPSLMGDYHVRNTSPAADRGAASLGTILAPKVDIDGEGRPAEDGWDIGADELLNPQPAIAPNVSPGSALINVAASGVAVAVAPASRQVPAGRVPARRGPACPRCTARLIVLGKNTRRTIRMKRVGSRFTVRVRGLRPGTYRTVVKVTNPRTKRTTTSKVRILRIPRRGLPTTVTRRLPASCMRCVARLVITGNDARKVIRMTRHGRRLSARVTGMGAGRYRTVVTLTNLRTKRVTRSKARVLRIAVKRTTPTVNHRITGGR